MEIYRVSYTNTGCDGFGHNMVTIGYFDDFTKAENALLKLQHSWYTDYKIEIIELNKIYNNIDNKFEKIIKYPDK